MTTAVRKSVMLGRSTSESTTRLRFLADRRSTITLSSLFLGILVIMPEPTHFLNPKFVPVAIIRPTSTKLGGARAAVNSFVKDGLFRGQKESPR
jgi:hypothetical protein